MMKKRIIIVFFAIIVLSLLSFRIISLNKKYPSPTIDKYTINQVINYNNFNIKATSYEFMDVESVKKTFNEEISYGQDVKCITVNLVIKNEGNQKNNIEIYNFVLESMAWKNGINLKAFTDLNSNINNPTLNPNLEPGESISLKIPFSMISEHFKGNQWNNVEKRSYSLILSLYPVKKMIDLSDV